MAEYRQLELPYMEDSKSHDGLDARLITREEFEEAVRIGEENYQRLRESLGYRVLPRFRRIRYR